MTKAVKQTSTPPSLTEREEAKKKHPDCIIMWRVQNNYIIYDYDAQRAANVVFGISNKTVSESVGFISEYTFPFNDIDTVLPMLVRAGYRIVIDETHI